MNIEHLVAQALELETDETARAYGFTVVGLPNPRYKNCPAEHTILVHIAGGGVFSGPSLEDALKDAVKETRAAKIRVLKGREQEVQKMLDDTKAAITLLEKP